MSTSPSRYEKDEFVKNLSTGFDKPGNPKSDGPMNEGRMADRIDKIMDACKRLNNIGVFRFNRSWMPSIKSSYNPIMIHAPSINLSYCGVGKAGGTFIKQLFAVATGSDRAKDLESISRVSIHVSLSRYDVQFRSDIWRKSRLITVGRNPYSRLFSAYIDRVFVPSISPEIRKDGQCRFDVTFEQFLKIILADVKRGKMDPHWSPIYHICKPCEVTGTFIVKQETFTDDIEFVVGKLGISDEKRKDIIRRLKDSRTTWSITGMVKEQMKVVKQITAVSKCISAFDAINRMWRAFQIQGYIYENIDLPIRLYNETRDFANETLLLRNIFEAIERHPMSNEDRKGQRHKAMVQAYKEVDKTVLDDIKKVFKPDFQMFEYSDDLPVDD